MNDPKKLLAHITSKLGRITERSVFVGGIVRPLLSTDPASAPMRPTKDVDVVVDDLRSPSDYEFLSQELREAGFRECTDEDAPRCRWVVDEVRVDVMSTHPGALGYVNVWYPGAVQFRCFVELNGVLVPIADPPHFVATKLEAYLSRGEGDYFHHDLEDVISLIDERAELAHEISRADNQLRRFVASTLQELLAQRDFRDALAGHLGADDASQARLPRLVERIQTITVLDDIEPLVQEPVHTGRRVPKRSSKKKATGQKRSQPFAPHPSSRVPSGAVTFPRSTNVLFATYDRDRSVLQVGFRSGSVYNYFGVSPNVFNAFATAPSAGRFVHQYLRGEYSYERVR